LEAVKESRKAVEEKIGLQVKKIGFRARKIGFWAKNLDFPKTLSRLWRFWGLVLAPDLLPRARMDLHDWFQLLTT
jgi:hypothetical protein